MTDRERNRDVGVASEVSEVREASKASESQGGSPRASMSPDVVNTCHYHRDLIVWRSSLDLADLVYATTKNFPASEKWILVEQLRRAAVSVPSNIAEGAARGSTRDFVHFLRIARGSLAEIETQLRIAQRVGYLREPGELFQLIERIERMLGALIAALCRRAGSAGSRVPAGADSANVSSGRR